MKIKMKKDPNKPKRAKTGFMFYCDEHRPKLINNFKKKNEKVDIKVVAKKLGESWKSLKDSKKEKYNVLAAKDKERYLEEMQEYNEKNEV